MRQEDLGRYQMLWDCPRCGTEKLLGLDHRHCPACGAPQDPDKRYYPPEGEEIAVEDSPYHGTDKACPACEAPNGALAAFCCTCGSPLDEAAEVKRKAEDRPAEAPPPAPPPPPKKGGKGLLGGLAVLVLLGLALFCAVAMFWKHEVGATVTGHTWSRTVEIEKQGTVTESAWQDELPKGARNTSCVKAQHGTKKVEDGEACATVKKDKGDGTFDKVKECHPKYREDPVYDQKCTYQLDTWVASRKVEAKGNKTTDNIAWPQSALKSGEREGKRVESYVVALKLDDGKASSCDTTQSRWAALTEGKHYKTKVGVISSSVDCDSLK